MYLRTFRAENEHCEDLSDLELSLVYILYEIQKIVKSLVYV